MSPKQIKIILSIGAVVLFVLLFIAPKVNFTGKENAENANSEKVTASTDLNANLDIYLNMATKNLEPSLKTKYQNFEKASASSIALFDSLVVFWNQLKRPDLASYALEKRALTTNKPEDWFFAGNRYYYSVQFTKDETERPVLFSSAIRSFKNGLKLDPKNVDAKIMMASCFVEGTPSPMEGISLLKEVERTDSNNVKLQLTFAMFSVRSGQTDKAISRFNKVLQLDSTYIEAYLHLADIYEQMNDVPKTIDVLEKYAKRTNDVTAKLEVEKYIKQLKSK